MDRSDAEKNHRVLVIDDNRAIHEDFRKILSQDATIAAALDATEAALFGSSTGATRQTFETLDFDLRGVIEGTLELLAEPAQAKGLELAGALGPEVRTQLRGDAGRLRQILTNLVSNAIKFTECGEVIVRVFQQSEDDSTVELRFDVKDSGVGIEPEAQARLFRAFTQADSTTTRKYGGTGLGLAISKQLTEMMHRQIGVDSPAGRGSTFWFTVRLEKQPSESKPALLSNAGLVNLRVLVVDDNATNREILRQQIFAWKMQNGSVASGREAMDILRTAAAKGTPYDLALLDMQMPEMDGLQLARAIKAEPAIAGTRLIILTSPGQQPEAGELKAFGIEACLVKPVKQLRLFDCLVSVMFEAASPVSSAKMAALPNVSVLGAVQAAADKIRVLLAEDNGVNQRVALGQLHKLGCMADAVANGREAVEALRRVPYDIVLMDCQMPEMDGYEATRRIRKREREEAAPPGSRVYIVAMTANALQGDREKCLAAGMDDYISKPVCAAGLKLTLEQWRLNRFDESTASPAGTERATPNSMQHIDLACLKDAGNHDPQQIRDLIDLYLSEAEIALLALTLAIEADSHAQVAYLAHRFFGASVSCGMLSLAAALRNLERTAKEGDSSQMRTLANDIAAEYRQVQQEIAGLSIA